MITVDNPVGKVFERWSEAIKEIVGDGNYSMRQSQTIVKTPYARLYLMGAPEAYRDLDGNESGTTISFQCESYAKDPAGAQKAYEIDAVSHKAMNEMGFTRNYGPELMDNYDSTICRVVSRYRMLYAGKLLGEE